MPPFGVEGAISPGKVPMDSEMLGLLENASKELEKLLNTKTVIGEPIEIQGRTVVPLISVGFGLGVGGGRGADKKNGEGGGSAIGMGGGARPIALLIADPSGIRLEAVKSGAASVFESIAATLAKVAEKKGAGDGPGGSA